MRALSRAAVVVAAFALLAPFGGQAAAEQPLPVPHDFTAGFLTELANPGGSLPGSNDFSCKPTAEHPRPVVLAHGTFLSRQANWSTYVPLLKNEGYCVFALTYGATQGAPWPLGIIGGVRPIEDSAREFGDFVDEVLAATGAEQVDVLGHSQGTLMPNYYVKFLGGAEKVRNYVSLAPLWGGSALSGDQGAAGLPAADEIPMDLIGDVCPACLQMDPGSDFIAKINQGGSPYVPGVAYTNIATRYDDTVVPYTSGLAPGPQTTNIVVQDQCELDMSTHGPLAASPVAAGHVLNALDPANPRAVPCVAVAASTGSPVG